MRDVEQRLSQIIAGHFGVDGGKIAPAVDFRSDMMADSLDLLELTLLVEDEFGIEIADEVVEQLHTVGDLVAFVRGQRGVLPAA